MLDGLILLELKENSTPVCREKIFISESIRTCFDLMIMVLPKALLLSCAVQQFAAKIIKAVIKAARIFPGIIKSLVAPVAADINNIVLLLMTSA